MCIFNKFVFLFVSLELFVYELNEINEIVHKIASIVITTINSTSVKAFLLILTIYKELKINFFLYILTQFSIIIKIKHLTDNVINYIINDWLCSNLHQWFLYIENWIVWDIRYTQIPYDDWNCFNWLKIEKTN